MYPAMIVALTGFMVTAISGFFVVEGISALFALVTFMSFLVWTSAVLGISHTVRCPTCQKRLGYLLLDPSYSKTFAPLNMPKDIPERITACPFCYNDFEEEITEPAPGENASRPTG